MKKKELDNMNIGDEVVDNKNRRFVFVGINDKSFYKFKGKKSGAVIGMTRSVVMDELEVLEK